MSGMTTNYFGDYMQKFENIIANDYVTLVAIGVLLVYCGFIAPILAKPIRDFLSVWMVQLVALCIIIYIGTKNIPLAIAITIAFVVSITMGHNEEYFGNETDEVPAHMKSLMSQYNKPMGQKISPMDMSDSVEDIIDEYQEHDESPHFVDGTEAKDDAEVSEYIDVERYESDGIIKQDDSIKDHTLDDIEGVDEGGKGGSYDDDDETHEMR